MNPIIEYGGVAYRTVDDIREREDEILRRVRSDVPADQHEALNAEWQALSRARIDAEDELRARGDALRSAARRPGNREDGASFHGRSTSRTPAEGRLGEVRERGLRAVDARSADLSAEAGDRLVDVIERDRSGLDARYIEAVADPHYERAFAKRLANPETAQYELTPDEADAMRRVAEVMGEQRALAVGTGSAGGFAVPFALDPTIILTSDGAANPLRQLATVTTIATSEWRGVSSQGVTASFDAEAAEVSDDTPTLAQPTIIPEKAQAFVPFSIEVGMDWNGIREELGRLFADEKERLEAQKYTLGAGHGSTEPEGIIVGATNVVTTAGTALFAIADVYSVQNALPPRYSPRAQWLSSNPIANIIYRFVGGGSSEPPLFNESRDRLLGKPWNEVSHMVSTTTTGSLNLLYGDIAAGFRIVDRIGLTVELVPHLFGANRRPSGERGLYAYWRTSSEVVNANALRVAKVK